MSHICSPVTWRHAQCCPGCLVRYEEALPEHIPETAQRHVIEAMRLEAVDLHNALMADWNTALGACVAATSAAIMSRNAEAIRKAEALLYILRLMCVAPVSPPFTPEGSFSVRATRLRNLHGNYRTLRGEVADLMVDAAAIT